MKDLKGENKEQEKPKKKSRGREKRPKRAATAVGH